MKRVGRVEEDLLILFFYIRELVSLAGGEACSNLGTFFEENYIDLKDFNRAVSLYKKACDFYDFGKLVTILGHIYELWKLIEGRGLEEELKEPKFYFE